MIEAKFEKYLIGIIPPSGEPVEITEEDLAEYKKKLKDAGINVSEFVFMNLEQQKELGI